MGVVLLPRPRGAVNQARRRTRRARMADREVGHMTSRGMVALLARRWYLLLLGAVLTVTGTYVATHRAGVYWSGYSVVVLAPTEKYYDNSLVNAHYEMSRIAGVFVRQWN